MKDRTTARTVENFIQVCSLHEHGAQEQSGDYEERGEEHLCAWILSIDKRRKDREGRGCCEPGMNASRIRVLVASATGTRRAALSLGLGFTTACTDLCHLPPMPLLACYRNGPRSSSFILCFATFSAPEYTNVASWEQRLFWAAHPLGNRTSLDTEGDAPNPARRARLPPSRYKRRASCDVGSPFARPPLLNIPFFRTSLSSHACPAFSSLYRLCPWSGSPRVGSTKRAHPVRFIVRGRGSCVVRIYSIPPHPSLLILLLQRVVSRPRTLQLGRRSLQPALSFS